MTLAQAKARFTTLIDSATGVDDERVREAFRKVPREQFVGPGPWMIPDGEGYVASKSSDHALLYDDIVVALIPEKRINSGQPTLHARCLSAARILPGEKVLQVGCGSGYYTAIISELVTPTGEVEGWDIEPELVAAASANLEGRPGVSVALRDATRGPIALRDLIYVCAGCTRPVRAWTEALSEGGRLIFPLTPGWDAGAMLMITRHGDRLKARFICRCAFIPCAGGSDPVDQSAVREAFTGRDLESVSSLHFGEVPTGPNIWLKGDGWWLSTADSRSVQPRPTPG